MNKFIVTTTINSPTLATLKFCEKQDWWFIIVGDLKTPHEEYYELEKRYNNVKYLSPDYQEKYYKDLSSIIPWNCIQRRNIGFVEAYNKGADVIASVDDDNIPYDNWGENLLINQTIEVDLFEPKNDLVFDPLSVTNNNWLWHRGYPIEYLNDRLNVEYKGKVNRRVFIQADLWDGDPDIDAIGRLIYKPIVKFNIEQPYCTNVYSPFNSQNTFLSRKVFPNYSVLPFLGRMDDIWAAYILEFFYPQSIVYNKASVYQERNAQDLIKNMENEILGYRNTLSLLKNIENFESYLPEKTLEFIKIYKKSFKNVNNI